MNYDEFRTLWHQALDEFELLPHPLWPTETIDLHQMSRAYSLSLLWKPGREPDTPTIGVDLSWEWDAILSARSATTEEDFVLEALGEEGQDLDTEPPWLRVDVVLRASWPWRSSFQVPKATVWRRWAEEVSGRLSPLLPTESYDRRWGVWRLSYCGDPVAEAECQADGRLFLTQVSLPAWQAIELPRQWDDPDRDRERLPEDQLAGLAKRVRQALVEWEDCLQVLLSSGRA